MATLRLSFKGRTLQVFYIEAADTVIGREPDCPVMIDSLAVAPQHARISCHSGQYSVIALDQDFPVLLNEQPITEHPLAQGDILQIGKHTLRFSDDRDSSADTTAEHTHLETEAQADPAKAASAEQVSGYMQILNGEHIGRIVPLKRSLIRFGHSGNACAVIARREDGFYLSHLEGETCPLVDGKTIGTQSHLLRNGNIVQIGPTQLQFHAESN